LQHNHSWGSSLHLPFKIGCAATPGPEIIHSVQSNADSTSELARYIALAEECRSQALKARHTPDEKAWLALAEEWQMLAERQPERANTPGGFQLATIIGSSHSKTLRD
jgi:hypothetical protein